MRLEAAVRHTESSRVASHEIIETCNRLISKGLGG